MNAAAERAAQAIVSLLGTQDTVITRNAIDDIVHQHIGQLDEDSRSELTRALTNTTVETVHRQTRHKIIMHINGDTTALPQEGRTQNADGAEIWRVTESDTQERQWFRESQRVMEKLSKVAHE
ncbi:MAG TPA: hypothetical protein VJB60_00795 [Candidatus Peribacterales bacterium]|nr:hypothetical protein [Candidatus Peribacterales bacterium]